ncbi:MAG: hypothetical protein Q8M26_03400 [Pseudolabrys sp.]|nr:hypothetical protein [Pseudolabrys sp.]
MTDTTTVVAIPTDQPTTNFDWGAIVGGALLASVLGLVLLSFGAAAGFASFSPYSWNNPSATTLSIIGVAWFSLVMMGTAIVGGYFTGRFRRRSGSVPLEEREARDGAHGLLMWAMSFVFGVAIAYAVASGAAQGIGSVAGGAASVAAQNVPQDRASGIVSNMLRPAGTEPAQVENPQAEVGRVLSNSALRGTITEEDRNYVARIVATEAKIPPDEARKRVDATIEQAKAAAEAARKAAAWLAFLIGAVSVLAAGGAFAGARYGGHEREENIWRR